MVFTGLIDRVNKKVRAAKFATKLAVAGGLASMVGALGADAQTIYMNADIKDSQGQSVSNGGNLQVGQTYTGTLSLKFEDPNQSLVLNPTSLTTAFKATFGGLADSTNVGFQYTSNPNPNIQGVPTSNDLFSGATMSTTSGNNNTSISDNTSSLTFNYNRAATGNYTNLSNGQNVAFLTFTLTPQANSTGGSVSFNYLTGAENYNFGAREGSFPLSFGPSQTNFLGGSLGNSGSLSYNFTAVPEPSTYATLAGGAVLVLAAWNRRRRQEAMKKSAAQYTSTSN